MRQATTTKYLGPTNFKGARIKATCEAGSITLSWDYAANPERNHERAAIALAMRLGWISPKAKGRKVLGGGTSKGYVWVLPEGKGA